MAEYVDVQWHEAMAWEAACEKGDCAYASEDCYPPDERSPRKCIFRHDHTCPGYVGVKHIESQMHIVRYRNCARRDRWWTTVMKPKIAQRKADRGRKQLPAPSAWKE